MKIDGNLIRALRLKKSWSQEELAEYAKVSVRTVQRIEIKGACSARSHRSIYEALDVDSTFQHSDREDIGLISKFVASEWRIFERKLLRLIEKIDSWVNLKSPQKLPAALKVVSLMFILFGFHQFYELAWAIVTPGNRTIFTLSGLVDGALFLFIGMKLLALNSEWRKLAMAYSLLVLVTACILITVAMIKPIEFSEITKVSLSIGLAIWGGKLGLYLWVISVLTRPNIKTLFTRPSLPLRPLQGQ